MKVKLKATVTYEWEDDTEYWEAVNPLTPDDFVKAVQDYVRDDYSYVLECGITGIKIEVVDPDRWYNEMPDQLKLQDEGDGW